MSAFRQTWLAGGCAVLLAGCDSLAYFGQAAAGHWDLLQNREPIVDLVAAPSTDAGLKQKLSLILEARTWAAEELGLKTGEAYSDFVALDRPYVVWNVVAAPEFSVAPTQWCFPIAGCVSYRGYFNEADAQQYVEELKRQGYDTYVGGVEAYSTLGWFDDPVLSTFIKRSDTSLVALVFHELAHRTLYVKNDSTFNESFATLIEQEGVRRWLAAKPVPDLSQQTAAPDNAWEQYQRQKQWQETFVTLVLDYRQQLEALYASPRPDDEKRAAKQQLGDHTRERYRQLRDRTWGGYNGYDRWFNGSLNNAQISTVATYHAYVPAFELLLQQCHQDMHCFLERVDALAEQAPEIRKAALDALLDEAKTANSGAKSTVSF